jgi:hypothetical protein
MEAAQHARSPIADRVILLSSITPMLNLDIS